MSEPTLIYDLRVSSVLYEAVNSQYLPGTDIDLPSFWSSFADIIRDFTPRNRELLKTRYSLQKKIDLWHIKRRGYPHDSRSYEEFLRNINYLVEEKESFQVATENVDIEISSISGPQLVAPMSNARYALNAANARWGSLFDALYGTDVLDENSGVTISDQYDSVRGQRVLSYVLKFLDRTVPFEHGVHTEIVSYKISNGALYCTLSNGRVTHLINTDHFLGYCGASENPTSILFRNNGLHIELQFDRQHPIGKDNVSGLCDVILESAITTIQDLEDSVAAVDANDKVNVYNHWLGLMKGDLSTTFVKNGKTITRSLNPDRQYKNPSGNLFSLSGRSIMLIRHVGHLMTNPAILTPEGEEVFEGIMDAMITGLISLHDLKGLGKYQNSRTRSIYVVTPKIHGPEETRFTVDLLGRVEAALGMDDNTIKIGIMDEERRTTVNLKECIRAASHRIIFINTGFLDRTGDEIHTSMESGVMIRKGEMKKQSWLQAYENWNVDVGLECGLPGRGQIGKGMWAMPDQMANMMQSKIDHPKAGATTAWVPSPTAATLHAIHYHEVDVAKQHKQLSKRDRASLNDILTPPICQNPNWSSAEIRQELENNCQSILGYVVRWIDQGIGCSKVPDINDIGLMEDRATLRISSQHIANWLHHDIISELQVLEVLRKMAVVVDQQNANDPNYWNMAPDFDGIAFSAARDLIFLGRDAVNGYTEPTLHSKRLELKAAQSQT